MRVFTLATSGGRAEQARQGAGVKPMKFVILAFSVLVALAAAATASVAEEAAPPAAAVPAPPTEGAPIATWDQAINIRKAAEHLGRLQRTRGAKGAYDFISACYKTQGLAETYSAPFEACIAQDFMQTQVLALIYSRMSTDQLKKLGSPSATELAEGMGRRVVAAFSQYKIPASYAGPFKKLVDQHGFPVFLAMVFPNARPPTTTAPDAKSGIPLQDNKPTDKP